ncbi:MAG: hypothetical protein HXP01_00430 [Streptococcus sp.]|uniref:hypothetical protein n=1 Tax=Streptococcus sp. TaxID=1306 RepID=UPI001CAE79D4|nr:hypothetical protein [Streptococcus sp.]MBF1737904.1 hypothetical protein [Streptococcus sp.]
MALVYLKMVEDGITGKDFIINTKNIKSVLNLGDMNNPEFEVCLMSGTAFNFNQLYYEGKFVYVYKMNQLYKLLTKLDNGVIQDGSS